MTKPKKKPKTGDVVGWGVIDEFNSIGGPYDTRRQARRIASIGNGRRVFKIVLAK